MKLLLPRFLSRSLAAGLLLLGAPLVAQDTFTPFAGTYQGLLVEAPSGAPAGRIDFAVTSKGSLSGALLLKNQKSYKFKSQLSFDEINTTAELTDLDVVKPKEGLELKLSLIVADDGSFSVDGNALVPGFEGEFVQLEDSAARLRFYKAKTDDCPWAGVYTMAFHDAVNNGDETPPGGASIGSATIKPDGVMAVKGTLADGTKFTASTRPSEDGSYRFFFGVHKTAGSYFTAFFRLTERGDDWYHVAADQGFARWAKSPNSKDKSYRDGFDASFDASVVQWKMPGKGEALRDFVGFGEYNVLPIDFSGLSTETYADFLPTTLGLTLKNTFRVASTDGETAVLDEKGWAKIFSGKVDPKTGLITITLNISDVVSGKTLKRKITMNGILAQLETDLLTVPYAYGHLLIPPLDPKTQTLTSGGFTLPGPIVEDEVFAAAGNTPGTYTGTLKELLRTVPGPSSAPANNSPVTFTISRNLQEMVFNGRKLSLQGDSRPVSLVYSDLTKKPLNSLTVTVHLNESGVVFAIFGASYQQLGQNATFNAATVTKQ
jgi:hypothetical protein